MAISKRKLVVFALGIALGAAMVGGAWMLTNRFSSGVGDNAKTAVRPAPAVVFAPRAAQNAASAPAPVTSASCLAQPAAAIVSKKDGKFAMQAEPSGNTSTDTASFIAVGKEAAAAGRPRDAEVAFLMACRVADKFKGGDSVEAADARYQLAWHYEWLANESGSAAATNRAELLKRAEGLYSDSLKLYVAKFGQGHEKSRFAADGLAALRQASATGQSVQRPVPTVEKPAEATVASKAAEPAAVSGDGGSGNARASRPQQQPPRTELVQAAPPAVPEPRPMERPRPSFDCGKARSVPEKMICSDAELARLDRDLGRLYARAKSATSDSGAFSRRNSDEWRRREASCRDRECLVNWYAHRRNQLLGDIDNAQYRAPPLNSR